jgi:hypothetical protein
MIFSCLDLVGPFAASPRVTAEKYAEQGMRGNVA